MDGCVRSAAWAALVLVTVAGTAAQETIFYSFEATKQVGARQPTKIRRGEALNFVVTRDLVNAAPRFLFRSPDDRAVFENRGRVSFTMEVRRDGVPVWSVSESGRVGDPSLLSPSGDARSYSWARFAGGPNLRAGDEVVVTTRQRGFPALAVDESYSVRAWFAGLDSPRQALAPSRRLHRSSGRVLKRWSQLGAGTFALPAQLPSGPVAAPRRFETVMTLTEDLESEFVCLHANAVVCEECAGAPDCEPVCSEKDQIKAKAVVRIRGSNGESERLKLSYKRRSDGFWNCEPFERELEAGQTVVSKLSLRKSVKELRVSGESVGGAVYLLD